MKHSCCLLPTLEHMTTCHYCGLRAEAMDADGSGRVGEPICKRCADSVRAECDAVARAEARLI